MLVEFQGAERQHEGGLRPAKVRRPSAVWQAAKIRGARKVTGLDSMRLGPLSLRETKWGRPRDIPPAYASHAREIHGMRRQHHHPQKPIKTTERTRR